MKNVIMALFVLLPVVGPVFLPDVAALPDLQPIRIEHNVADRTRVRPSVVVSKPQEIEKPVINKGMSLQTMVSQFNLEYGQTDPGDLLDVELTYKALEEKLGRKLELREIMYITIWSEYWFAVKGKTHALLGQEALARSYYQFCGEDGECSKEELIKFLSGYQPWFGNLAKIDMKHEKRAEQLYIFLTNEFNYSVNGEEVYMYADQILDVEYAREQGWTSGKQWNRPSQWYGPAGAPPCNSCTGSMTASYAIASVPYGGGYFYFVTYGQEQSFTPTAVP